MPSFLELLIIAYFIPSLVPVLPFLKVFYPSILNLLIPESIKLILPLESTSLDYIQFAVALFVSIISLILGYKVYKKNPDYWLNKIFAAFYVGIAAAAVSFNLGLFINATGLIIGQKFMLSFILISLGLLLIVSVGLNYGEIQIRYLKATRTIILYVTLPMIVVWLPGSIVILDVAPPDTAFSDLLVVVLLITLAVGLSVLSHYLIKVYRASEGILKRRILFFLAGFLSTLLFGGISTSLASTLSLQIFDLISPLVVLIGISIVYYGLHISE